MKTFFFILLISQMVWASEATLERIKGVGQVTLVKGGQVQVANTGDKLASGDVLITGPENSASVKFSDGTRIIVGRSNEFSMLEDQKRTPAGELKGGVIRAIVPKAKVKPTPSSFRFFIKTNNAVMGVRNTEFIVMAEKEKKHTTVYCIEGTVEITESFDGVTKSVKCKGGFTIQINEDKIGTPEKFDREMFLNNFSKNQPEIQAIEKSEGPDESFKSGGSDKAKKRKSPTGRSFKSK